ncbi:MAG: hypothetical protein IT536_05205 [Hyphomicrobiales bacterium]|nr:hypothetical protein [Hyphomicrobiales bacterium]
MIEELGNAIVTRGCDGEGGTMALSECFHVSHVRVSHIRVSHIRASHIRMAPSSGPLKPDGLADDRGPAPPGC